MEGGAQGHGERHVCAGERANACMRDCLTLFSSVFTSGSSMLGMATLPPLVWDEALCHSGDLFGL